MLMRSPESAKVTLFIASFTLVVAFVLLRRMAPRNPAPLASPAGVPAAPVSGVTTA
jgi:hypothetical protein